MNIDNFLQEKFYPAYGAKPYQGGDATIESVSPIDLKTLAEVPVASEKEYEQVISDLQEVFLKWRALPAPQRGLIVREIGEEIRKCKDQLGELITLEMGKILEEGKGEVQEVIDVIDFSVGLSRQLYGNTIKSERPEHRMIEQWQPLGIVGVITAFNFPAAVWGWNAFIAATCGNVILWKPSEITPLTSIAINNIASKVVEAHGYPGVFSLVIGDGPSLGQKLAADKRVALVSATGSTAMGKAVSETVAKRLGKVILELGGNNAVIVMDDADLNLAIPALLFGAVGTAGQRCTTTRRILVHKDIKAELTEKLLSAYKQVRIGNPLDSKTLVGPLINQKAVDIYTSALDTIKSQGGKILYGAEVLSNQPSNLYVTPTIVDASHDLPIVQEETFAPIVYLIEIDSVEQAIQINNDVPQGLSSAIFTSNLKNSGQFISAWGSDCGIANVNIGTSGAEIGGAFGGEKDTGGGRESGSDSWKAYMRRQSTTINFGDQLPLAQGIKFEL